MRSPCARPRLCQCSTTSVHQPLRRWQLYISWWRAVQEVMTQKPSSEADIPLIQRGRAGPVMFSAHERSQLLALNEMATKGGSQTLRSLSFSVRSPRWFRTREAWAPAQRIVDRWLVIGLYVRFASHNQEQGLEGLMKILTWHVTPWRRRRLVERRETRFTRSFTVQLSPDVLVLDQARMMRSRIEMNTSRM